MMRVMTAAMAASLFAAPALAEFEAPPVTIPQLTKSGVQAEDFAPPGWIVEAKAEGDVDGDKSPDIAFVLRGTDPALKVKNDGLGPDEVDTNPRIIGVAVSREGGYQLVAHNATLIPRNDIPTREDPFVKTDFAIVKGSLYVGLTHFMSAGGWGASNVSFNFRVRDGKVEAIGYDRTDTQRNSGETETVSVNYLTRKMSRSKGTIESDPGKETKVWSDVPARRGPTIDEIGDGLDFEAPGGSGAR